MWKVYVLHIVYFLSYFYFFYFIVFALFQSFFKISAKDAMFLSTSVCWPVGLLVCHQDYMKTSQQISTKLGWKMGLVPE